MARTMRLKAFEQQIDLIVARVTPPKLQELHAKVARQALGDHLASLPSKPPVKRIVDGQVGAVEETVKAYGLIRYEFSYLREMAKYGLEQARAVSPVDSGKYRDSWIALADGVPTDPDAIPDGTAEVLITNPEPYSRKLNVGKNLDGTSFVLEVPPNFVETASAAVRRRFGNAAVIQFKYVSLHGAYVIKIGNATLLAREAARRGVTDVAKSRLQVRRDRSAGAEVTYPAFSIRMR